MVTQTKNQKTKAVQEGVPGERTGLYKPAILLFVGAWVLAFFTSHATLSVDPPNRYMVARSMVDYGDLQIRLIPGEFKPPGAREGVDGNSYSSFGIGQPLIFAGPYYLCKHILGIDSHKLIRSIISITIFPVTLALTGLVFFALMGEFGFSRSQSYIGALLVIFATGLWQVSKEGQEASHLALLFTVVAYGLRRYQNRGSIKALVLSALAMAFSFLVRADTAPTVMCYLIFAFYLIHQNNLRAATSKTLWPGLIPYILVIISTLPGLLIHSYINYSSFGKYLMPPHNNPMSVLFLPQGLMGLLFSPGRSLFLYNPIFIFSIVGGVFLCEKMKPGIN